MPDPNPLIGTWSLIAWYNEREDGTRVYPLGEDASGYISYSLDGFVFVHLAAGNRQPFANKDPFTGTDAENTAAMPSHITYAGRFTDNGDHVVHHMTECSLPNWVGSEQRREKAFVSDRLILSAAGASFQGLAVTAFVEWERAG